jgi:hypothetical protein
MRRNNFLGRAPLVHHDDQILRFCDIEPSSHVSRFQSPARSAYFSRGRRFTLFTVAALGTMGQFPLLAAPVLLVMQLLSGGATPMESMPIWLHI